jgi:nucleotide-binding universal stress UspA family protein
MAILVTSDGSPQSRRILSHAARFAESCGQGLLLVRVLSQATDLGGDRAGDVETATRNVSAAWEEGLRGQLAGIGAAGEAAVVVARHGEDTEAALLRTATERGAVMVAMQSRGAGALRRALIGSVALGVLRHSHLPVMMGGQRLDDVRRAEGYHLVLTSDGSEASADVVRALAPLLAGTAVRVTLLRAWEPRSGRAGPAEEQECAKANLESLRALLPAGQEVATEVTVAHDGERAPAAIVRAARALGADALGMSTHGHGALRQLVAGSVALGVLEESPLPVILGRLS